MYISTNDRRFVTERHYKLRSTVDRVKWAFVVIVVSGILYLFVWTNNNKKKKPWTIYGRKLITPRMWGDRRHRWQRFFVEFEAEPVVPSLNMVRGQPGLWDGVEGKSDVRTSKIEFSRKTNYERAAAATTTSLGNQVGGGNLRAGELRARVFAGPSVYKHDPCSSHPDDVFIVKLLIAFRARDARPWGNTRWNVLFFLFMYFFFLFYTLSFAWDQSFMVVFRRFPLRIIKRTWYNVPRTNSLSNSNSSRHFVFFVQCFSKLFVPLQIKQRFTYIHTQMNNEH